MREGVVAAAVANGHTAAQPVIVVEVLVVLVLVVVVVVVVV